jgi:hypothetical protein
MEKQMYFLKICNGRDAGSRVKPSVLHAHERFSERVHKKKERQGTEYMCQELKLNRE